MRPGIRSRVGVATTDQLPPQSVLLKGPAPGWPSADRLASPVPQYTTGCFRSASTANAPTFSEVNPWLAALQGASWPGRCHTPPPAAPARDVAGVLGMGDHGGHPSCDVRGADTLPERLRRG